MLVIMTLPPLGVDADVTPSAGVESAVQFAGVFGPGPILSRVAPFRVSLVSTLKVVPVLVSMAILPYTVCGSVSSTATGRLGVTVDVFVGVEVGVLDAV